jgi:hypothetical protein
MMGESRSNPAGGAAERKKSGLVCLATIAPQEVKWLWKPYIPIGKVTLLRGDPSYGKTFLLLTLAAIVSNGWAFPGCENSAATEAGDVLYLTVEDGLADTIVPRLINAKADMEKLFSYRQASFADAISYVDSGFEQLIQDVKPRLVIADPIQGFLGTKVNTHRSNEVRPIMSYVGMLAEKYDCAIVLIEHLSKRADGNGLYRGVGSVDFTAAARSVLMVGINPENESDRGMAHIKSNCAPNGAVIGYSIIDGKIVWNLNTTLTKDIIVNGYAKPAEKGVSKLDEAKGFLKEILSGGERAREDVIAHAELNGISESTLNRAKQELKVKSASVGFGADKVTYWSLYAAAQNQISLYDEENPFDRDRAP